MKIVCPYTEIEKRTRDGLDSTTYPWEERWVGESLTAYWDLLSGLWKAGETFVIVEHDIVIHPDTIDDLLDCDAPWCAATYPYLDGMYPGLGCMKFDEKLMARLPDLLDQVATFNYPGHGPKHYCTLDAAIQRNLWSSGLWACVNHKSVGHMHRWPGHGCVPVPEGKVDPDNFGEPFWGPR